MIGKRRSQPASKEPKHTSRMNPTTSKTLIVFLVAMLQCSQMISAKSFQTQPQLQFDDSSSDDDSSETGPMDASGNNFAGAQYDRPVGAEKLSARSMADEGDESAALSGKDLRGDANNDEIDAATEFDSSIEPAGLDTNIENARVSVTPQDMSTAAGHHHHHHHYVHGWLEMGAHTGKKGSFGWHDKHPVGGKGRR